MTGISRTGSNNFIICTSSTRPSNPSEGIMIYETDTSLALVHNGSAWVCITPVSDLVNTYQATTSTSYTDLATTGPSVTIQTGTEAIVTISSFDFQTTGGQGYTSFAVSGASTVAASDLRAVNQNNLAFAQSGAFVAYITGLTAGSNTFTMKYRTTSNTHTSGNRNITVVGIP